jgi:hypothetical protein
MADEMAEDGGNDVKRVMEKVLGTPMTSDWSVTGPSIRGSVRRRWIQFVPVPSLVAAAVVVAALVTGVVLNAGTDESSRHRAAIAPGTRGVGTTPGTVAPTPSTNPSATSVPPSSAPTTVPPGTPSTSAPAPTTTSLPAIGPKAIPASCVPTASPIEVSTGTATACLAVGAVRTVNFTQASEFGGVPGAWIGSATSENQAVVVVESSMTNGSVLSAQIRGVAPGTVTVIVSFQNQCSTSTTTPCTIPPQGQESLTVQVTN